MPEFTTVSTRIPYVKPNPDSMAGVHQVVKEIHAGGVPRMTWELAYMRASQIDGCNGCMAYGLQNATSVGITTGQLVSLPAGSTPAAGVAPGGVNTTLRIQARRAGLRRG